MRSLGGWLLALAGLLGATGCAEEDSSTPENSAATSAAFKGWEGSWSSYARYLDEPSMMSTYKVIADAYNATFSAESGKTHTAESVKAHWKMLYGTDFGGVKLEGDKATFLGLDGTTEASSCTYRALGCQKVYYVGDKNAWQLEPAEEAWDETWCRFEAVDMKCGAYNRIIMTDFHIHEGESDAHGHLRYGDVSFENLWDDQFTGHGRNNHYWWPTLISSTKTVADYAALESGNATENAEYLTY